MARSPSKLHPAVQHPTTRTETSRWSRLVAAAVSRGDIAWTPDQEPSPEHTLAPAADSGGRQLSPTRVPALRRDPGWRWRESNPRPTTHHQGFSERSPLRLCSTPPIPRTSRCDGPSRCLVSRARPRPARTVSHLADARIRADDEPGLTESPRYLGSEGELALTGVGACVVSDAWLTSSSSASSARFPWSSDRSRDHSPPV